MDKREFERRSIVEEAFINGVGIEQSRRPFELPKMEEDETQEEYETVYHEEIAQSKLIGVWEDAIALKTLDWDNYDYRYKQPKITTYANVFLLDDKGKHTVRTYNTEEEALQNKHPGYLRTTILSE